MLWYKAWLETRFRFLIGAALVCALCAFFVLGNPFILGTWSEHQQLHPAEAELPWILRATTDYPYFIWHFLFARLLQQLWVLFAVIIGLGGLSRESAQGTAGFILSLPLSRRRIVCVRAALGGIEVAVLGLIPAIAIPALSIFIGKPYPAFQAVSHALLMVLGGLVFFGLGVMLSTAIQSEHTPALIGVAIVLLFYFFLSPYTDDGVIEPLWIKLLDVSRVMAGTPALSSFSTYPLRGICISLLTACGLFYLSLRMTEKRDY
ncbi:MAG TPA: ABC transporter permease subunit [Pyrinomonadaceae bacterium]|jgi:ABC-2 type transport system permease protein|nr:ABC transporter permease subunit [Pyrinomonadaceae bacterium]